MHTISRYHDFSYGHRVHGHENKCAHLHGHNGRIIFVCSTTGLDSIGRVVDFSVVKALLCEWLEKNWDHKFLLWYMDPWSETLQKIDQDGVVLLPFNPTAENMAAYLVDTIGPFLLGESGVKLVSCTVEETRKCSATYHAI